MACVHSREYCCALGRQFVRGLTASRSGQYNVHLRVPPSYTGMADSASAVRGSSVGQDPGRLFPSAVRVSSKVHPHSRRFVACDVTAVIQLRWHHVNGHVMESSKHIIRRMREKGARLVTTPSLQNLMSNDQHAYDSPERHTTSSASMALQLKRKGASAAR